MSGTLIDRNGFVDVAAVADLSNASGRIVEVGGIWIAIFLVEGRPHAIENACPHMAGPLGSGTCTDGVVTCPIHGWRFDVRTGEAPTNPNTRVACFETRVVNDRVLVRVSKTVEDILHS